MKRGNLQASFTERAFEHDNPPAVPTAYMEDWNDRNIGPSTLDFPKT